MRFYWSLPVLVFVAFPFAAMAQPREPGQTNLAKAAKIAELIGVTSEVSELRKLSGSIGSDDRWQILWLHQHIAERILTVSLMVDATRAEIDNEISRLNEISSYLSEHASQRANQFNLWAAILGGGLGATSSGLQLGSRTGRAADFVGIGAGVASAGLGIAGLQAQNGRSARFPFDSNMLAEIFGRPALPNSQYPTIIWDYMNTTFPGGPTVTPKEQLIQLWIQVQRIDSLDSTAKIERLTSQPSGQMKLTLDDFQDRAAMLEDVRARMSLLKRDLSDLIAVLPEVTHAKQ